ncbi:MAG TPA: S46 family peptidase, partial [Bacteroidales bacterium]|nr:S46 family peptidase [Bacteroidales bacterium]
MARKFFVLVLILKFLFNVFVYADEGMWIPLLLEKYNFEDMKAKGFKLTAEDIYSVNNASMKDAVVIFGRGCTGEMISEKGLLITNHHCGYGQIQRHSSLENDYLTQGFWAKDMSEELPNPGLTVTFLISMEDVTENVLQGVSDKITEAERYQIIKKNINKITSEAVKNTHYKARVESFYNGNQYFLFINEVFEDVRLVGAPPSAIGKFGGDT